MVQNQNGKPNGTPIRDLIREFRRVPASQLLADKQNFREHDPKQRQLIRKALEEIGIAGALLVRERADGKLKLIDGHMRRDELEALGDQEVPVLILDVSETEAIDLMLTYDALGRLAKENKKKKQALQHKTDSEYVAMLGLADEERVGEELHQDAETIKKYNDLISLVKKSKNKKLVDTAAEKGLLDLEVPPSPKKEKTKKKKPVPNYEISTTRMVQLFFDNKTSFPEFIKMCQYLGKELNTSNITDTVLVTLREFYALKGGQ